MQSSSIRPNRAARRQAEGLLLAILRTKIRTLRTARAGRRHDRDARRGGHHADASLLVTRAP